MKFELGFLKSAIAGMVSLTLLASCGGGKTEPDATGDIEQNDLVPTNIAVGGGINTSGTLFSVGFNVPVAVVASNVAGNLIFDGVIAEFVSPETGAIEPSCVIQGTGCEVAWQSGGREPTSRVVTLMVMVPGAEPYEDLNGNNMYDEGEPFEDLVEPFIDENDNLAFDEGEYYNDVNSNGVFDAVANGVWDGPCDLTTGSCAGNEEAILFSWHHMYLCESEPDTGAQPLCDENIIPSYRAMIGVDADTDLLQRTGPIPVN